MYKRMQRVVYTLRRWRKKLKALQFIKENILLKQAARDDKINVLYGREKLIYLYVFGAFDPI